MRNIDKISYNYSFKLHNSVITTTIKTERDFTIKLSNLKLNKYLDKIDLNQDTYYISAKLICSGIILYGYEPDYPSRIIDYSLVKDGEIFGNHINYPFIISGDIQFVITFVSYEKLTIRAQKMYLMMLDPRFAGQDLQ